MSCQLCVPIFRRVKILKCPYIFKSLSHSISSMKHFQIHGEDASIPYLSNVEFKIDCIVSSITILATPCGKTITLRCTCIILHRHHRRRRFHPLCENRLEGLLCSNAYSDEYDRKRKWSLLMRTCVQEKKTRRLPFVLK